MKFLCDQCKAKYQISDDKVAGKTVRMKCRKCGHMIEVRAAVTETSVANSMPSEPPTAIAPAGGSGKPAAPPKPANIPGRTPLATSLSAAKPAPPRPTQRPDGGLAGAFNKTLQKDDEAALLELASADEWYAAINGVPVGPIRIGELRRKAAVGAVTDESLVWQEGMEEWRPVRTVPELAAMVREAATSGRVSMLSPEPPQVKSIPPAPLVPSMRPGQRPIAPQRPPAEPPRPAAATARSNVVPITSRLATAEKLDEAPAADAQRMPPGSPQPSSERFSIAPDPFAIGGALGGAAAAPNVPLPTPAPAAASAAGGSGAMPFPVAPVAPKREPNYIAIGMLIMFAIFGGMGGYAMFFMKQQPAPVAPPPQVIVMPGPTAAPTAAPAPVDTTPVPSATAKGSGKIALAPKASASATAAPLDLRGLIPPPGSPQLAPGAGSLSTSPGAGPSGGGGLSQSQIETVVRGHSVGVRRTCWERGTSGVNNANITVHLEISGSGSVSSATANGNDAVTGKCLENETQRWTFPGGPAKVDIPFHFVRQ